MSHPPSTPAKKTKSALGCLLVAGTLGLLLVFRGCGFVHDEKLVGPYRLNAVDLSEQMCVAYDLGDGTEIGRISETVFAVGWDERYIVAKQHPKNDRSVTNFYYLVVAYDSPYADPDVSVRGPFTSEEFARKQAELRLPSFKRTIKSLE